MATSGISGSAPDGGDGGDGDKELRRWSSLIGIITAIVGNVLIALALNVQRYAHIRLRRQRSYNRARAEAALKRAQGVANANGRGGYGTMAGDQTPHENGNGTHEPDETAPLAASFEPDEPLESDGSAGDVEDSSTYLKSPYWWAGQILITLGETGNFLAYGFAPASIVSPLGVVALIANCVIAPILFHERFRAQDFWGVVIAVAGVVTVVLSAKQQETKLEPHDVWDAITTIEFEIYMAVTGFLIGVLMWASSKYGKRTILIDLGLVGLFGGYTALATKGVSSMLSSTLFGAFTTPVTYVLVLVLLGTAIMQIRYVNRALSRFDSTQVIPIQFVMFTLCVIIGSAVLYRDFERTTAEQAVKFVGGCLLTFFGVFLITSGRQRKDDEDMLSAEEGVEETIGLHVQGANGQSAHPGPTRRQSTSSRRSSRASRVSFVDGLTKPLSVLRESGVPSLRAPAAAPPKSSPEAAPLLVDPWLQASDEHTEESAARAPNASTESVVSSVAVATPASDAPTPPLVTASAPHIPTIHAPDVPMTPRASISGRPTSRHYPDLLISPSPLSSTVSAVVNDTLRRHGDNLLMHKSSLGRIRSSIRASLFMPDSDEEDGNEGTRLIEDPATLSDGAAEDIVSVINGQEGAEGSNSIRRRARSLSSTIGDLFKRKRKDRLANSEGDTAEEDGAAREQE